MSVSGIWYDKDNEGAPWGVMLYVRGTEVFGFYYGFNSVGGKLWLELSYSEVFNTDRAGRADPAQGQFVVTPHDDGSIDFHMTVPRGWTHPVDTSPSPASTTIRARLNRVL